jgi:hypothetical protein
VWLPDDTPVSASQVRPGSLSRNCHCGAGFHAGLTLAEVHAGGLVLANSKMRAMHQFSNPFVKAFRLCPLLFPSQVTCSANSHCYCHPPSLFFGPLDDSSIRHVHSRLQVSTAREHCFVCTACIQFSLLSRIMHLYTCDCILCYIYSVKSYEPSK